MKKDQTETMELKNTMNRMKNATKSSTADIVKQTKEPVTSKIIYFKLPSQWRKKKKRMRKSEERLHESWDTIKKTI